MPTRVEHKVNAWTVDPQTGKLVPTVVTFLVDHKSFERTRAALAANRGAGDSYYRRCNSPGFDPRNFIYVVTMKDLGSLEEPKAIGHYHHPGS